MQPPLSWKATPAACIPRSAGRARKGHCSPHHCLRRVFGNDGSPVKLQPQLVTDASSVNLVAAGGVFNHVLKAADVVLHLKTLPPFRVFGPTTVGAMTGPSAMTACQSVVVRSQTPCRCSCPILSTIDHPLGASHSASPCGHDSRTCNTHHPCSQPPRFSM